MIPPPIPHLLGIDPSIANLGFASLDGNEGLLSTGQLRQVYDPHTDYHIRGYRMATAVAQMVSSICDDPVHIIIETPANWFGQRGTASKDDEAIQKLYYQVGAIIGILSRHDLILSIWGVTPSQWKGQAPKRVMVRRAYDYAREQGKALRPSIPHDAAEALLLARYALAHYEPATGLFTEPLIQIYKQGDPPSGAFHQEEFIILSEGF